MLTIWRFEQSHGQTVSACRALGRHRVDSSPTMAFFTFDSTDSCTFVDAPSA